VDLLAIPFGLAIGLIVGAVGGGGAILALPVLVYVLDEPVGPATTASLIVVAMAASVGAGSLARDGAVCWRLALTFSGPAALGSLAGTIASKHVSGQALIIGFIPVMLLASFGTWQRAGADQPDASEECPTVGLGPIAAAGLAVGVLTGFFGVGGGFVIVPVLALGFKLAFRRAVATSLVIITITGCAALASHLAQGAEIDVGVTAAMGLSTAVGALCGTLVGNRLPQRLLGKAFAIVVAAVAMFLLIDTLAFGGPPV
jgi:uncharacterized membrane protein YfcA